MVSAMTADCKLAFGSDKSHENPGAQEDRPMTSFLGMRGARTVICLIQAFGEFIHVPRPFIHPASLAGPSTAGERVSG